MRSEVPSGSSNLRGASAMDQGDRQIAQSGQKLRSRASMHTRAIFAKGDITHIMQGILDPPMTAVQIAETLGARLQDGQIGNEIHNFLGGLARFANRYRACDTSHLTHQRPRGSQIVVQSSGDLHRPYPGPPPAG